MKKNRLLVLLAMLMAALTATLAPAKAQDPVTTIIPDKSLTPTGWTTSFWNDTFSGSFSFTAGMRVVSPDLTVNSSGNVYHVPIGSASAGTLEVSVGATIPVWTCVKARLLSDSNPSQAEMFRTSIPFLERPAFYGYNTTPTQEGRLGDYTFGGYYNVAQQGIGLNIDTSIDQTFTYRLLIYDAQDTHILTHVTIYVVVGSGGLPVDPTVYFDADGDGVIDDPLLDEYLHSAPLNKPIDVNGGRTGVVPGLFNFHMGYGWTLQDHINAYRLLDAGNKKQYVRDIASLAEGLYFSGIINLETKKYMVKHAAL